MTIEYLADHTDVIPVLARWFHDEWGYLYQDLTVADVAQRIGERTNRESIPLALVAFDGEELVGTVCLKTNDMDTRPELMPWLAGLYVSASRRRQGIGERLVAAIEHKARELGVRTLFLYTPESENFYAKLGWQVNERTTYRGHPVTVMQKAITL